MQNLVEQLMRDRPDDWLSFLQETYKIGVVRDGDLASLKYDQIKSPMSVPIVQQCRGMVVDVADRQVLAWPYNKFWNLGEALADPVDWSTARCLEKLDGSLMILYRYRDAWCVASSDHPTAGGRFGNSSTTFRDAFWATWRDLGYRLPTEEMHVDTMMFEFCAQENCVVVQHERPRIVLHGARRMTDGREAAFGWLCWAAKEIGCEIVRHFPHTSTAACDEAVRALDPVQQEGFVVVDNWHRRVKIKSPRYVALHHMKGNLSPRRAVALWQSGDSGELLSYFPEFAPVVQPILDRLDEVAARSVADYEAHRHLPTRKEFALAIKDFPHSGVIFKLLGAAPEDRTVDGAKAIMRAGTLLGLERLAGVEGGSGDESP